MPQLLVDNVGRAFAERRVFAGIRRDLSVGDRLLVRGSNGSGKSTLLKILAGLLAASEGRVVYRIDGAERTPHEARHAIGYLAPDLVLYDELTLIENLDCFARLRRLPTGGPNRLRLGRVGLADRADEPYGTLSTGLRQRVKLAFATQADPAVLLLDEPGSNLDASGHALVEAAVAEAAVRGIVVIATNDPDEFGLGNQVLELD
jgi:heme exporter protein A